MTSEKQFVRLWCHAFRSGVEACAGCRVNARGARWHRKVFHEVDKGREK